MIILPEKSPTKNVLCIIILTAFLRQGITVELWRESELGAMMLDTIVKVKYHLLDYPTYFKLDDVNYPKPKWNWKEVNDER